MLIFTSMSQHIDPNILFQSIYQRHEVTVAGKDQIAVIQSD